MKKLMLLQWSIIMITGSICFGKEIKVKSKISAVTVFQKGAEITRDCKLHLNAGENQIVLGGLSPNIKPKSIQAKGKGEFLIQSVSFRLNYLHLQPKSVEMKRLEDSLSIIKDELDREAAMRAVLESEKEMILSNRNLGGQNTGVSTIEIEKMANLLRSRLSEIALKKIVIEKVIVLLNEKNTTLRNQLAQIQNKRNQATGEIVIELKTKRSGKSNLQINYVVIDAGWVPAYDLRASDIQSPLMIHQKANVFQNTGNDWNNINLTLSTGNPTSNQNKPSLSPWRLSFVHPQTYEKNSVGGMQRLKSRAYKKQSAAMPSDELNSDAEVLNMQSVVQMNHQATTIEYQIEIPYSIASNQKAKMVDIQHIEANAIFSYYCAPELDKSAFLLARITDWELFNLLPGEANIYFEESYVGQYYFNPNDTQDTLEISLGRDHNVGIERTLMKDFTTRKFIGSNCKEYFVYDITIRNKKSSEIQVEIQDRIPLSPSNEIQILLTEKSDANYQEEDGYLSWTLKIAPSKDKSLRFGYQVKYPKGKTIANLASAY